jgi:transposase
MAVAISRREYSASDLRRAAAASKDAKAARRMLALALVMEGASRQEAARACGMDRQSLRDWVHRYNAEGLAGLHDRPRGRSRSRLTVEQVAEFAAVVEAGPDVVVDGVVRWRRVDLKALIEERFDVRYHERTVGKLLRRLGFRRLSPRPVHPKADLQAQEAFKKTSPPWPRRPCPTTPGASPSRCGSRTRRASVRKAL